VSEIAEDAASYSDTTARCFTSLNMTMMLMAYPCHRERERTISLRMQRRLMDATASCFTSFNMTMMLMAYRCHQVAILPNSQFVIVNGCVVVK
jgi:hypothetical protein